MTFVNKKFLFLKLFFKLVDVVDSVTFYMNEVPSRCPLFQIDEATYPYGIVLEILSLSTMLVE